MLLKGNVSTVDNVNKKARVTFKDLDNGVSAWLPVAPHVGNLNIEDMVVAVIFSRNMNDGLVIAKF